MTESKKIAILCNYELLPERVGGMDYFFWLFDKQCKEKNIQVDWFFPNLSHHGEYFNLSIHDCNYNVENYFFAFCKQNETDYSHIITHFLELCTPSFYKIKQFSKAEIIAIDHNPRPLNGYPLKKKIEKRIKGILFSRYIDVFVGVSEYSKSELIKEFGAQIEKKSIIIFNGLEISKFKKKKNFSSNNQFIVASHLRKEKGIQDLILAVKDLKSFDFTIDIYGKGYFEGEFKKMIQDFSLQRFFNFKGSVSNLTEIYCEYDYLIHPSHGETFCYSVVESLMSNLPVITTRNQGNVLGLVVENKNGFLFEECNVAELKGILKNILKHKFLIGNCWENSKLKNFSLTKMVANHLALVLNNKP
ncbi:glycosyltransferase family 4 protein [Flavobacterium sp. LT1R49]|uniref:glycosyltransferase family 4 protein n=1 Tax=Flavobacterium arabinosi TaxID=3398737 RepID=UPI003A87B7D8